MTARAGRAGRALRATALALCLLPFAGCGFHLRRTAALPPALARLRVDAGGAYPAYLRAMRDVIEEDTHVKLEPASAHVPELTLFNERLTQQVLSLDTNGNASAYLLEYQLSFRLKDAAGKPLLGPQTVRLQREQAFDRYNVLANDREQAYLVDAMRDQAARLILRRISAWARHAS